MSPILSVDGRNIRDLYSETPLSAAQFPESERIDYQILLAGAAPTPRSLVFALDNRIGVMPTKREAVELHEQVPDSEFIALRDALLAGLTSSRYQMDTNRLRELSDSHRFPERFAPEFDILRRLGYHPFPSATEDTTFDLYDKDMNPQVTIQDKFDNISRQPVVTALFLDSVCNIAQFFAAPLLTKPEQEQLIGDIILLKALKPLEVMDRIATKKAVLVDTQPDSEKRMSDHIKRLVRSGTITREEGDRIFDIATHTVGVGGFDKFLSLDENGNIVVGSDLHHRLLRAADDITAVHRVDGAESFHYVTPAEKILVISGRRGQGLLGRCMIADPTSPNGLNTLLVSEDGTVPEGHKALGTMGQMQDLLSSAILTEVTFKIGAIPGCNENPVKSLLNFVNQQMNQSHE